MQAGNELILVVEDDRQIRNFLTHVLEAAGFTAKTAVTGQIALAMLVSEKFTVVLLDLGLPDLDGLEVIKKLREWSEIPIIVVSARDQDKEIVATLDAGADDYLTKPFSENELLARIRVALRHAHKAGNEQEESATVTVGTLSMDFASHRCLLDGAEIHLTPTEYRLLALFFRNPGKVLTAKYIIKEIWGAAYADNTDTLRAHMAALRRKLEKNPATPRYLLTEIGVGYRLAGE